MIVTANVFTILQTVNIMVRPLSKKRCLRKRFDTHHVKECEISMRPLLSCFFIILREVVLENVSPSVR